MTYGIIGFFLLIVMVLLAGTAFKKDENEKKVAFSLGVAILMVIVGMMFFVGGLRSVSYLFFLVGALMLLNYLEIKGKLPKGFGEMPEADKKEQKAAPNESTMSRAEAYRILGLTEKPSKADVRAAYKKMMMKHHPDKEGDAAAAAKINAARDALLKGE